MMAEPPHIYKKCDWCGNDLLKMRNGVMQRWEPRGKTNNNICDACWKAHRSEKL